LFLIYAAGWDHLLLSCILYAPAAIVYSIARRERGLRVFNVGAAVLFALIVLGAVAGIYGLVSGDIAV
jgi:arginine:ornithine antiporter/lysine permease